MFGVAGLRVAMGLREAPHRWRVARARLGYLLWSLIWIVGHVAGGVLVGSLLGWIGSLLPVHGSPTGLVLLAAASAAIALYELGLLRLRLPEIPRQVPRDWMLDLPWSVTAFGYGLQLGSGIATRIRAAALYVVLGCALLSGSTRSGSILLGVFGFARALLPIAAGPRVASPERSLAFAVAFDRHEPRVRRANGVLLVGAAVWFAWLAWRWV